MKRLRSLSALLLRGAAGSWLALTSCSTSTGDADYTTPNHFDAGTVPDAPASNLDSSSPPEAQAPLDAAAEAQASDAASHPDSAVAPDASEPEPDASEPDADLPWPTCDTQPSGVQARTLPEIWQQDPTAPTPVWVPNLYVTAISKGRCSSGTACQVFLQADETYGSLTEGAHKAIKLFISSNTAGHFSSLAVGDKVNVYAHAWRYNVTAPQNELLLQVRVDLRGCAQKIGTGNPTPIQGVQLTDLSVQGYEHTYGPLLVRIDTVSGKPAATTRTFALWHTGGPYTDSGPESVVSLSPYFLSNGAFSGLPTTGSTTVNFQYVQGVFGLFVPSADAGTSAKYMMLYPRSMQDVVRLP